eukprot:5173935-Karenia_brevis.AAC.1
MPATPAVVMVPQPALHGQPGGLALLEHGSNPGQRHSLCSSQRAAKPVDRIKSCKPFNSPVVMPCGGSTVLVDCHLHLLLLDSAIRPSSPIRLEARGLELGAWGLGLGLWDLEFGVWGYEP